MLDRCQRCVVVVVDDQPIVREFVEHALQRLGYEVLTAHDAKACLGLMRACAGPVHLVISDILMPGMSGTHLAEVIARERPDTRVLLMTGMTEDEVPKQWAAKLLFKPFTADFLQKRVREALDSAACQGSPPGVT